MEESKSAEELKVVIEYVESVISEVTTDLKLNDILLPSNVTSHWDASIRVYKLKDQYIFPNHLRNKNNDTGTVCKVILDKKSYTVQVWNRDTPESENLFDHDLFKSRVREAIEFWNPTFAAEHQSVFRGTFFRFCDLDGKPKQ